MNQENIQIRGRDIINRLGIEIPQLNGVEITPTDIRQRNKQRINYLVDKISQGKIKNIIVPTDGGLTAYYKLVTALKAINIPINFKLITANKLSKKFGEEVRNTPDATLEGHARVGLYGLEELGGYLDGETIILDDMFDMGFIGDAIYIALYEDPSIMGPINRIDFEALTIKDVSQADRNARHNYRYSIPSDHDSVQHFPSQWILTTNGLDGSTAGIIRAEKLFEFTEDELIELEILERTCGLAMAKRNGSNFIKTRQDFEDYRRLLIINNEILLDSGIDYNEDIEQGIEIIKQDPLYQLYDKAIRCKSADEKGEVLETYHLLQKGDF